MSVVMGFLLIMLMILERLLIQVQLSILFLLVILEFLYILLNCAIVIRDISKFVSWRFGLGGTTMTRIRVRPKFGPGPMGIGERLVTVEIYNTLGEGGAQAGAVSCGINANARFFTGRQRAFIEGQYIQNYKPNKFKIIFII
ncbi:hypothetical protein ACJX0J_015484 [Zea mays]